MTSGATQKRNPENVNLLAADFQPRYEPNFAWKSGCSNFQTLTGLRGYWPTSAIAYANPQLLDLSANGSHLTTNNIPTFGYSNLIQYVSFNGVNQSASRPDGGAGNWADILGTEGYIAAGQRGLTLGAWAYLTSFVPVTNPILAKWGAANQLAYMLCELGGFWRMYISQLGTPASSVNVVGSAAALDTWVFVVGRFVPGATVDVYVNGTKTSQATAIPAIFDSTATFYIGYDAANNSYLTSRVSHAFLCASALSDSIIGALFQQTRAMYNV